VAGGVFAGIAVATVLKQRRKRKRTDEDADRRAEDQRQARERIRLRNDARAAHAALQLRIQALESELRRTATQIEQTHSLHTAQLEQLQGEVDVANAARQTSVIELEGELDTARQQRTTANEARVAAEAQVITANEERDQLQGEVDDANAARQAEPMLPTTADEVCKQLTSERDLLTTARDQLTTERNQLMTERDLLQNEATTANAALAEHVTYAEQLEKAKVFVGEMSEALRERERDTGKKTAQEALHEVVQLAVLSDERIDTEDLKEDANRLMKHAPENDENMLDNGVTSALNPKIALNYSKGVKIAQYTHDDPDKSRPQAIKFLFGKTKNTLLTECGRFASIILKRRALKFVATCALENVPFQKITKLLLYLGDALDAHDDRFIFCD